MTPRWIIDFVVDRFFEGSADFLDPALPGKTDGLEIDWTGRPVFINPPFRTRKDWLRRASEILNTSENAVNIVFLVPFSVDTEYWARYVTPFVSTVVLIERRVAFKGYKGGFPGPICLVHYSSEGEEGRLAHEYLKQPSYM